MNMNMIKFKNSSPDDVKNLYIEYEQNEQNFQVKASCKMMLMLMMMMMMMHYEILILEFLFSKVDLLSYLISFIHFNLLYLKLKHKHKVNFSFSFHSFIQGKFYFNFSFILIPVSFLVRIKLLGSSTKF